MIYVSIVLFALAAGLGLSMLIKWLTQKEASKGVIYSHGIAAAVALVLLIIFSFRNPAKFPEASLILFVLAALGGFYLFFKTFKKQPGPVGVALVHALLAVAGFVALLLFVFA